MEASAFRAGMEFHCGVPCMQDAFVAAVLDFDGAGRADRGARPAADAGVGMEIKGSAYFPFYSVSYKRDGGCADHVTADTHAQAAEHAQFIGPFQRWSAETGGGYSMLRSHLLYYAGARTTA